MVMLFFGVVTLAAVGAVEPRLVALTLSLVMLISAT